MNSNFQDTHAKLLLCDILSLTPSLSLFFYHRRGVYLSRAEVLGIVTYREHRPNKFLKFAIDDGTGCFFCVLWLNHCTSFFFSHRNSNDVRLIAEMARNQASEIRIGAVVRVRGRIVNYRGAVQLTVSDVVIERDPNVEILHWLECLRLAVT